MTVNFFIAGIIQGSIADKCIHNQDYRIRLKTILERHFPTGNIYCPFDNHPASLDYGREKGHQVFFDLMAKASEADALIAFLPEASMGSAIEMWEAYHKNKTIITISPLKENWVINFLSTAVFDDIMAFERFVESGKFQEMIESKSSSCKAGFNRWHCALSSLTNMLLGEIEDICISLNHKPYHAAQICSWIYKDGALSAEEMTNLPKSLRRQLHERCPIYQSKVKTVVKDADGTEKFLIHLYDGNLIESVLIREGQRITVCVSTQIGCASKCGFCASGMYGLVRNLSTGEIVEQLLHIKNSLPPDQLISNVVLMGIGEPLANYDNVIKAVRIINSDWGFGIGARKITISTVGLINGIKRLADEGLQINLSISLHAPNDAVRDLIVPVNKGAGVKNVLAAAKEYFKKTGREITFEYVLIDGLNSSDRDAMELARRLKGFQCNINVIPLNPVPAFTFRPPSENDIKAFCSILEKQGLNVNLRKRKGGQINAACGQLRAVFILPCINSATSYINKT